MQSFIVSLLSIFFISAKRFYDSDFLGIYSTGEHRKVGERCHLSIQRNRGEEWHLQKYKVWPSVCWPDFKICTKDFGSEPVRMLGKERMLWFCVKNDEQDAKVWLIKSIPIRVTEK